MIDVTLKLSAAVQAARSNKYVHGTVPGVHLEAAVDEDYSRYKCMVLFWWCSWWCWCAAGVPLAGTTAYIGLL